ncbi:hypothetical protein M569_02372, partial [Genlisea aurea]
MAATVSVWGKPGAWALDSEENESELIPKDDKEESSIAIGKSDGGETEEFPSLSAAVSKKPKKKKAQTVSLQHFSLYGATKPSPSENKGLTPDELLMLPTGPRERSAEELERNKLGGGFRSYGGGIRDDQQRRNFNRESNRDFAPSRADETDDWGATKKFSSSGSGFDRKERGDRGGFFTDSQSRADEVDNWASSKSFVPSDPRRNDRKPGFGFDTNNNGIDSSSWMKRKEEEGRKVVGGAFDSLRERRGGGFEPSRVDSDNWGRRKEEVSIGGSRPKLNLQPRTLPVDEGQKSETGTASKPKGGSNPFGEARPREEVLKEKGQDWKEIEQKLESVKIKESGSPGVNTGSASKKGFWNGNGGGEKVQDDRSWKKSE